MEPFQLLPAIDLRGGRVVRLRRGDFARETAYSDDPRAVARSFVGEGATWLHVVDLDGARTGIPEHAKAIRQIVAAVGSSALIEIAGGLRTFDAVEAAFQLGATRVVVGTSVLADAAFAGELVRRHGAQRVIAALDVRDEQAVGNAWMDGASGIPIGEALARLVRVGMEWFEVTAIQRDGMLSGPDLDLFRLVGRETRARVIAAGGIASSADLQALQEIGCAGAIIGRALYEGTLTLGAALAAVQGDDRGNGHSADRGAEFG